ncbi:MAG: peptidase M14 [Ignavibacteriales bacterium]|nr:peptidase M14 [Ignavibacteriales bacterium]
MKWMLQYSQELFQEYSDYRVDEFRERSIHPELLQKKLDDFVQQSAGLLRIRSAGRSFENRDIRLISTGNGEISVILWSQMHGDESTATMAICDIINYLFKTINKNITRQILSSLRLLFLPLLNPDGAARNQRRTAQGIDMNRDALALVTPEAQILKQLQNEFKPQFGFNLHDQELSTVGPKKEIAAIGLLSPSINHDKSDNDVRIRSKFIASAFTVTMNQFIQGKVTKYDDSFEPRAFGDNMQKWGTSTLLVESGHVPNDPEKDFIRKLNFLGILSTLFAIASSKYKTFDLSIYDQLPFNGKRAYDVIIRNIVIEHAGTKTTPADLGISYQVDTHSELPPKLVDIGDLHSFVGLREIDGKGKSIPESLLSINQPFEWERYF